MPSYLQGPLGIGLVPVLHGRLEFAATVRRAFREYRPERVAVELPRSLGRAVRACAGHLPNISVVVRRRAESATYLLVEPTDPLIEAVRSGLELGLDVHFVDAEVEEYPEHAEPWPDSYGLTRLGVEGFAGPFIQDPPRASDQDRLRETTIAHRLQDLAQGGRRTLVVCGLAHAGRILEMLEEVQPLPLSRPMSAAEPANLNPDSIKDVCSEIPYLMKSYEAWRTTETDQVPDRLLAHERLYEESAQAFKKATGEEIKPWQFKVLRRFRRNWALLSGRLSPDFYQVVVAAKGVGGDEFAHAVYQTAVEYPWVDLRPDWETISLSAADLGRDQRRVSFFKPLRRTRRRLRPVPEKPLAKESYPGQWSDVWQSGTGICSHVPEDLIIEDFGRRAADKALARLAEENRTVEPFTVSLRDGPDIRETLRRVTEERLYVYEERATSGGVGAVVVVFDDDDGQDEEFPWKLTWLGEHQDESDMAFYATLPGDDLVGPGISRCLYGGLVMTYPPQRMIDIWSDPFFDPARSKPGRLLLAGADYSRERVIAYIAKKPPPARERAIAHKMGHQVAYLPIGIFGPAFIQKIRVFHVLSGHDVRDHAEEYIGSREIPPGSGGG